MKFFQNAKQSVRIIFMITISLILYLVFRYQENYRENRALLTSAVIAVVSFLFLFVLIGIHMVIKKKCFFYNYNMDKVIAWMTVGLWIFSGYIFCNIYFRTGWDVWTIDYAAKVLNGKTEYIDWLNWYFGKYPNNILLTSVYAAALKINDLFGIFDTQNGQIVFICLNSLSACLSAWLTYDCVKKICNQWLAVVGWGCCALLICLSPWTTIPYSDALTAGIPVLIFWLFLKIKSRENPILWAVIFFLGILGGHIKPQVFIVLIAVTIYTILSAKKENGKEFVVIIIFCMLGTIAAQCSYHKIYNDFSKQISFHSEDKVSWQHFIMMGLNNESNGMWNNEDVNFSESFDTKEERAEQCLKEAGKRLKELGLQNYSALINKKLCICFSDGTFSWSRNLGDFYSEIYEEKNQLAAPYFRSLYYYDGNNYPVNATIRQICWCSILILIFFASIYETDRNKIVLMLVFVGCAAFEAIFEAATRHLYCNIPLFIILAMIGFHDMETFVLRIMPYILNHKINLKRS